MNTSLRYCILILFLLKMQNGLAQVAHPFTLFLHTDKNVYTNNEQIWFSGFLKGDSTLKVDQHTTLFLTIKDEYHRVVLQERYLMVDGLSFGCLQLTDSIPPGNYHVIAHTNVVNREMQPAAYFQTPIKIKYIKGQGMAVDFKILADSPPAQKFNVQITAKEKNGMPVKGAKVSYVCNENEINTGLTDKMGGKLISIDKNSISGRSILITVKSAASIQYLRIPFQQAPKPGINLKFYPEGGNICVDLLNTVGWVAMSGDGRPLKIKGILLEDNSPIDTVETESYGIGKFTFVKKPRSTYKVKLLKNRFQAVDTLYNLPEASTDAVALRILHAVANDTLNLSVTSRYEKRITLLVHYYNSVFGKVKLVLQPLAMKNIKVALLNVPKGVNTITILDSLNKPLAERNFFSAYNSTIKPEVTLPKTAYNKKEKVNVKMNLKDNKGNPVQGIVSIACVQGNRISENIKTDIETYTYLTSALGGLPFRAFDRPYDNKGYLENLLLISRLIHNRQKISVDSIDAAGNLRSVEFQGYVTRFNKKLNKSVKLTILRDSVVDIIQTKQDGSFYLTAQNMITAYGKKISVLINENNKEGYNVTLKSPEFNIKGLEVDDFQNLDFKNDENTDNTYQDGLSVFENINQLSEVIIKGKKDNAVFESFSSSYQGNPCGDYIAICNGLNCPLPGHNYLKKAPIKGRMYIRHVIINDIITSNVPVLYSGCVDQPKSNVFTFDGVNTTKEFYGILEYSAQSTGMDYISTIYWNPGLIIAQDGSASFSFITSDIPGEFKIVVDGIGTNELIHIEKEFTVN
jgi:hypothetical protein